MVKVLTEDEYERLQMTSDERELVFRIGQACCGQARWWSLISPAPVEASAIDSDGERRKFVRTKLADMLYRLRQEHDYEPYDVGEL